MYQEDLDNMNKCMEKTKGSMMLWCDAKSSPESNTSGCKRKKKADEPPPSKRQQIEDELDTVVKDLQKRHTGRYMLPQFRCWACMITSGKHQDRDNIPAFLDLDNQPKKQNFAATNACRCNH